MHFPTISEPVQNFSGHYTTLIRPLYGLYTAIITPIYGLYTAIIWPIYGPYTAIIRPLHGRCTAFIQPLYGHYTAIIRPLHGLYTAFIWPIYGNYTASVPVNPPAPAAGRTNRSYCFTEIDRKNRQLVAFTNSGLTVGDALEAVHLKGAYF